MAVLASMVVKLVGDVSEFESAMSKAATRAKDFGDKMTGVGKKMTAGVTLPLVGLGLVAVNAASDFEESLSKVNVVFGDNAQAIIDWSEDSATAMGMSQEKALEAVGTYGNLLISMGLYPDTAAEMSTGFVGLASDLASFNNASPEETLLALRSALTGEFEPMKRFGVVLNEASVFQKALDEGLVKTKEDMTPAIKSMAVYALTMEQTTLAQGDFARTSDGLANSTRIAKAQFSDAAAAIGQELLPVAMQIVGVITGWLESFKNLSPEMRRIIVIVAAVVAAIGPLLMIVGTLVSAIGAIGPAVVFVVGILSGPLLLIIGAVIAIIALLTLAWKNNWGDIQGKTQAVIEFIRNLIQGALEWIQQFWTDHGEQIKAIVQGLWDGVKAIFDWFVGIAREIFAAFSALFKGDWEALKEALKNIWDKLWTAIKSVFETVKQALITAFGIAKTTLSNVWDALKIALTDLWNKTWDAIKLAFENAKNALNTAFENAKKALSDIWEGLKTSLTEIWDKAWEAIKTAFENAKTALGEKAKAMIERIKGAFDINWGQLGRNIISGIAKGVGAAAGLLANAAKRAAKKAWSAIKSFFRFGSLPKLMVNMGAQLMEGLAFGLEQTSRLEQAIEGFAIPVMNAVPHEMGLSSFAGGQTIPSAVGGSAATQAPMIVYGGLHLHGVEDAESMSDELMELRS